MKLRNPLKAITLLACASFAFIYSYSQTTFIQYRSIWKYWDQTPSVVHASGWQTTAFSDAAWPSDSAELGYGDTDEPTATTISFGSDASNKYRAAYFRRSVNIPNPGAFTSFSFGVERDDGFVIYVNGVEVARNNMPAGTIDSTTFALSPAVDDSTIIITVPTSVFSPEIILSLLKCTR